MPGDPWLAILVESVSREISALLFTGSLSEGSQECTVTLSTLAEVGTLGTACSLLLQIYPRTVWWRWCLSRAPGESVGALTQPSQGTYMYYRFPPVLVRVHRLAGVMNLIHICTGRRRALSGACLGASSLHHLFSPQTPGPTIWENPHFHHVWSDMVTPAASST